MSENSPLDWSEVERAFAEAHDLAASGQAAVLARLSEPVRAEVASLLAAHARAGSFLGDSKIPSAAAAPLNPRSIEADTVIGSYRIEAMIGAGGMGIVYRALDTKLNRPVAVKFLFDELGDPVARRRFQREAQLASSRNHPHIVSVYDIGEYEGSLYMVTEFIDAGTLTTWARSQKRTWREFVALLVGVADALGTAHEAGILHRDIKPDNILVGRNGYAKLSDFGIAKLQQRPAEDEATRTMGADTTLAGTIVGTVAYMSPEQASGRPVDARSDIFSFGVLLYEMLAGRRPFQGKTNREVLMSIARDAPPSLPADVPAALRTIVEKALEKDPAERYQGMRDLVVDLRRLSRKSEEPLPAPPPPVARSHWPVLALAALCFALLLAGLLWFRRPAAEAARQVVQFDIPFPPGTVYAPTVSRQSFSISPDGKKLVFVATAAEGTHVWLRELSAPDMRPLPGTEGAWSVFWAPDSRSVYFSVRKTLRQVNLDSGAGRVVAELPAIPMFATWRSPGEAILFYGPGQILDLRLADGSSTNGRTFPGLRWPLFLPGGKTILYSMYDSKEGRSHVMAAGYSNGQPVALTPTDSRAEYSPPSHSGSPGYMLLIRGGSLLAQPFDAEGLHVHGEPVALAQNVIYYGSNFSASFSSSDTGVLVYQANFPRAELKWYDQAGKEVGTAGAPAPYWGNVRLSRDGRRVAAPVWSGETGSQSIWTFDADGRDSRRVTFPPEVYRRPTWSPDGTRLAVGRSARVGFPQAGIVDLVRGGSPLEFTSDFKAHLTLPTDWSTDGRFIAFDDGIGEEQHTVWIGDAGTRKLTPLLDGDFAHWGGAFAPGAVDQIAFASTESGRPEVYVQSFEESPTPHVAGERHAVSREGAWLVRWRADGRELFYLGLDNVLYAVEVHGKGQFGEPKALFRVPGVPQYNTSRDFQFDVSPDGKRFILPTTGTLSPPPFTVVENWQSRFQR